MCLQTGGITHMKVIAVSSSVKKQGTEAYNAEMYSDKLFAMARAMGMEKELMTALAGSKADTTDHADMLNDVKHELLDYEKPLHHIDKALEGMRVLHQLIDPTVPEYIEALEDFYHTTWNLLSEVLHNGLTEELKLAKEYNGLKCSVLFADK